MHDVSVDGIDSIDHSFVKKKSIVEEKNTEISILQ